MRSCHTVWLMLSALFLGGGAGQVPGVDTVQRQGPLTSPPASGPAPYTKGNSSTTIFNESRVELPDLWRILFQPEIGATHDVVAAVAEPVPGTTAVQVNAVAGYVLNRNPISQAQVVGVGVALGGYTINAVDGAQSWALDLIQTDAPEAKGKIGRLLQNEADFKPLFENTAVNGFILAMDSPVQPTTADGWICGKTQNVSGPVPAGVGRWNHCVISYPGAAVSALLVGAASVSGTKLSDSQSIEFQLSDQAGRFHALTLHASNDHYLVLQRDDKGVADLALTNGNVLLQAGHGIFVDGHPLVGGPVPETSKSPCQPGATTSDSGYFYTCVAVDTWRRAPLSSW